MGFERWATEQLGEVTRLVERQVATDLVIGQVGLGKRTPSWVGNLLMPEELEYSKDGARLVPSAAYRRAWIALA